MKEFLAAVILAVSIFVFSAMALASPGASILYQETDLGTGLWQYDYTFNNTSTADESLYSVYLFYPAGDSDRLVASNGMGWYFMGWHKYN